MNHRHGRRFILHEQPTAPTQCLSRTEWELQRDGVYLSLEQAERLRELEALRRVEWDRNIGEGMGRGRIKRVG